MDKVNLFLLGPPRCGTTSLAAFLDGIEGVCFSNPKEPYFFNDDIWKRGCYSIGEYHACFSHASPSDFVFAEGSVFYFYSDSAIRKILQYNPSAKFVVVLRNPIDLVYSLHGKLLSQCDENISDFSVAWNLQSDRRAGKSIPALCADSKVLQYSEMGKIGTRMKFIMSMIPDENLKIIIFDELINNSDAIAKDLLEFIGISPASIPLLPRENSHSINRRNIISNTIKAAVVFKNSVPVIRNFRFGVYSRLLDLSSRPGVRANLSPNVRALLSSEFQPEVRLLSELLARDFSNWLK